MTGQFSGDLGSSFRPIPLNEAISLLRSAVNANPRELAITVAELKAHGYEGKEWDPTTYNYPSDVDEHFRDRRR